MPGEFQRQTFFDGPLVAVSYNVAYFKSCHVLFFSRVNLLGALFLAPVPVPVAVAVAVKEEAWETLA